LRIPEFVPLGVHFKLELLIISASEEAYLRNKSHSYSPSNHNKRTITSDQDGIKQAVASRVIIFSMLGTDTIVGVGHRFSAILLLMLAKPKASWRDCRSSEAVCSRLKKAAFPSMIYRSTYCVYCGRRTWINDNLPLIKRWRSIDREKIGRSSSSDWVCFVLMRVKLVKVLGELSITVRSFLWLAGIVASGISKWAESSFYRELVTDKRQLSTDVVQLDILGPYRLEKSLMGIVV